MHACNLMRFVEILIFIYIRTYREMMLLNVFYSAISREVTLVCCLSVHGFLAAGSDVAKYFHNPVEGRRLAKVFVINNSLY